MLAEHDQPIVLRRFRPKYCQPASEVPQVKGILNDIEPKSLFVQRPVRQPLQERVLKYLGEYALDALPQGFAESHFRSPLFNV
jgi:hypothetical protein